MTRHEKRRAALIGVFILTCYAIAAWFEPCDNAPGCTPTNYASR